MHPKSQTLLGCILYSFFYFKKSKRLRGLFSVVRGIYCIEIL